MRKSARTSEPVMKYTFLDPEGKPRQSDLPGRLGGYRGPNYEWLYSRLDCSSAKAQIERGGYKPWRVFFADEETAIAAGHRPGGVCLRKEYKVWKATTLS
jgi:hypothetical protein